VAELRWLLLLLGIGVIAAVYLYTRYQPRLTERVREKSFRKEPSIGNATGEPADEPTEEPGNLSHEASIPASDSVSPAPDIPAESGKVVAIRLMSRDAAGFAADQLLLVFRECGLRHGQFGIFHRLAENDAGSAVFSVASLVEPGSFDLTKIKTEHYPGVSIFLSLPGPHDGVSAFDDMLTLARELAERLDGDLLDEQGSALSIQRERYMREEVIQFEHRAPG